MYVLIVRKLNVMAILLLIFLISLPSSIVASNFGDQSGLADDSLVGSPFSPTRTVAGVGEEPKVSTPADSRLFSDSMDSAQLEKYPHGKTPANIDPFEGQNICKLIKQKKYTEVANRIDSCLNGHSERAQASLKKKLRATTKFSINHATVVTYIPIEYVARKYEQPKEGEPQGHATEIVQLFATLAKAHIELLGSLPVSLDELCKYKEELLEILNRYRSEMRAETLNNQELSEGRPRYTPSPMATPDRRTSLNFSGILGSADNSTIDLSASFSSTPAAQSTVKVQKSLFGDDDGDDSLTEEQSANKGHTNGSRKEGAKKKALFSDEEEADAEDGEEQVSDDELEIDESDDIQQPNDIKQLDNARKEADAEVAPKEVTSKEAQTKEESSANPQKDSSKWALSGEQLRALGGYMQRNKNAFIVGTVLAAVALVGWKYFSAGDEASHNRE